MMKVLFVGVRQEEQDEVGRGRESIYGTVRRIFSDEKNDRSEYSLEPAF